MRSSVVFTRVCPRFCVLRATSRRQAKRGGEFAPAVTQLLMLRVRGADTRGRVSFGAGLLSGVVVKRAVPLLQNETQNMNTTEDLITTGCPAAGPQPIIKVIKPIKFPANRTNG